MRRRGENFTSCKTDVPGVSSGEVGSDNADPLAGLERGEVEGGDIGGREDALSQFEGAFHPVTINGADHLVKALSYVLRGN